MARHKFPTTQVGHQMWSCVGTFAPVACRGMVAAATGPPVSRGTCCYGVGVPASSLYLDVKVGAFGDLLRSARREVLSVGGGDSLRDMRDSSPRPMQPVAPFSDFFVSGRTRPSRAAMLKPRLSAPEAGEDAGAAESLASSERICSPYPRSMVLVKAEENCAAVADLSVRPFPLAEPQLRCSHSLSAVVANCCVSRATLCGGDDTPPVALSVELKLDRYDELDAEYNQIVCIEFASGSSCFAVHDAVLYSVFVDDCVKRWEQGTAAFFLQGVFVGVKLHPTVGFLARESPGGCDDGRPGFGRRMIWRPPLLRLLTIGALAGTVRGGGVAGHDTSPSSLGPPTPVSHGTSLSMKFLFITIFLLIFAAIMANYISSYGDARVLHFSCRGLPSLQPLVLIFSGLIRQLLLRCKYKDSASTWDRGLSSLYIRQHYQLYLLVVGMPLNRWLYRSFLYRRCARSVHLGVHVGGIPSGVPANTPHQQNLHILCRSRRCCLTIRSLDHDVIWTLFESLYVIWLH